MKQINKSPGYAQIFCSTSTYEALCQFTPPRHACVKLYVSTDFVCSRAASKISFTFCLNIVLFQSLTTSHILRLSQHVIEAVVRHKYSNPRCDKM